MHAVDISPNPQTMLNRDIATIGGIRGLYKSHPGQYMSAEFYCTAKGGGGDSLFPAEGHSDIYTVVRGTYKISNLEISLIYLVKHVINSFLM